MKRPYEFLIRWDLNTGKISGAHVGFANVFVEDGQTHVGQIDPVQPVAMGRQAGFPLKDVIGEITSTALAKCDDLEAQLKEERDARAVSDAEVARLRSELEQISAQMASPSVAQAS